MHCLVFKEEIKKKGGEREREARQEATSSTRLRVNYSTSKHLPAYDHVRTTARLLNLEGERKETNRDRVGGEEREE